MSVAVHSAFGTWLRARRKALDLTQFDLAERVGLAESTVQRIEAGERRPSKQVAALLAEALAVPAADQVAFVRFARAEGPPPMPAPATAAAAAAAPLPTPLTPLLGRAAALQTAQDLLTNPHGRLLTLTGPPGVGKTRLALALAAALAPAFPGGACFVPLAPLRDPALLADYVARALGLQDSPAGPPGMRLGAYLRDQRLLLVLDNFEQVVAAAPRISEWLATAPGVRILVTSRAALRLRSERRFPVSPLTVPPPGTPAPPEVLLGYSAVALFVERAQAADPAFALTAANAEAVAALCVWLEGVPLALELAAARAARLSPEEVRVRLPRRLDLSAGGLRDLPVQQQTLRAAVAWSYDLLEPDERKLFQRLAVFAGGATLHALEAVANAHGDLTGGVAGAVEGLLDASLLQQASAPEGGPRFGLLEMVREYAHEQLAAQGEAEPLARLYAEYYLGLAELADPELSGPDQVAWLNRLEAEHDNFRAVLTWARAQAAEAMLLRLAGALGVFWRVRGYWTEGRTWLEQALAGASGAPGPRLRALVQLGWLTLRQGDRPAARLAGQVALPLARAQGDTRLVGESLYLLAKTAGETGAAGEPAALFAESLACYDQVGDRWGRALILFEWGLAAWMRRDWGPAQVRTEEALALYRALGDTRMIAHTLLNLGCILHAQGALAPARRYYEESLPLLQAIGDSWGLGAVLGNLGLAATGQHDYAAAAAFYEQSLPLRRRLGNAAELGRLLNNLGDLAWAVADRGQARRWFEEAGTVLQEVTPPDPHAAWVRARLALVAVAEGALIEAEAHGRGALADPGNRAGLPAFAALAATAARRDQYRRAAVLIGAFYALSADLGGDLIIQPEDFVPESLVEEVRERLGAQAFAAARAAGAGLDWAAARAFALGEEANPLRDESGPVAAPPPPRAPTAEPEDAICAYLAQQGCARLPDLSRLLPDRDPRTVRNYLAGLRSAGRVIKHGQGRRTYYTLAAAPTTDARPPAAPPESG